MRRNYTSQLSVDHTIKMFDPKVEQGIKEIDIEQDIRRGLTISIEG